MPEPRKEPKLIDAPCRSIAREPGVEPVRAVEFLDLPRRRVGRPLAEDLGRDPLRHLADHPAVAAQKLVARMALDINKPRRDDQPVGVDRPRGGAPERPGRRDPRDPVAADGHVAQEPVVAGAVDDPAPRRSAGRTPGGRGLRSVAARGLKTISATLGSSGIVSRSTFPSAL